MRFFSLKMIEILRGYYDHKNQANERMHSLGNAVPTLTIRLALSNVPFSFYKTLIINKLRYKPLSETNE